MDPSGEYWSFVVVVAVAVIMRFADDAESSSRFCHSLSGIAGAASSLQGRAVVVVVVGPLENIGE